MLSRVARAENVAFVVGAAVTALFIVGQVFDPSFDVIAGLVLTILSFSACAFATVCVRWIWKGFGDHQSLVWLCIALGFSLFFLAYLSGSIYTLVGVEVSLGSVLDVFFVSGDVLLISGLLMQLWPFKEEVSRNAILYVGPFGFLLLSALLLLFTQSHVASVDLVVLISFLYPVLDIALLVVTIPLVLVFRTGTFWKPWLFLALGVILAFSGDLSLAYLSLIQAQTVLAAGDLFELFFGLASISAGLAFYLRLKQIKTRAI